MMSDHLAGMNEKLTQQKDEIDELKSQHANTTKPSSSSKVGKVNFLPLYVYFHENRCRGTLYWVTIEVGILEIYFCLTL